MNIRYAENTVDFNDDKLELIGWADRKAKTLLAPPTQARLLETPEQPEQCEGWVFLDWKAPVKSGSVSVYKVMRSERSARNWEEVACGIQRGNTGRADAR